MPELPEVETVVQGLRVALAGKVLTNVQVRRYDLRYPVPEDFVERVDGRQVILIARRAKYILITLDDSTVMILHLGMSGRIVVSSGLSQPRIHDHLVFQTNSGAAVTFNDPRRFGMITLAEQDSCYDHAWLRKLGPEPLTNDFTAGTLLVRLQGKRASIKSSLLDQRVVAGLGNIYVCEALYWAGISPRRLSTNIGLKRALRLVAAVKSVLADAIAAGGSSLRDYVQSSGELGYFQNKLAVYNREGKPCPTCDCESGIERLVQSGRSTFYCPRKQR